MPLQLHMACKPRPHPSKISFTNQPPMSLIICSIVCRPSSGWFRWRTADKLHAQIWLPCVVVPPNWVRPCHLIVLSAVGSTRQPMVLALAGRIVGTTTGLNILHKNAAFQPTVNAMLVRNQETVSISLPQTQCY